MEEKVQTICVKCVPENFNWKGLYEYVLCFRHVKSPIGSEDDRVAEEKLLARKILSDQASSGLETNRLRGEWLRRSRGKQ